MIVVLCIFLCLAVITTTVVVTVWKKLCRTPQCSSVHGGSMHSPGGRKLSDEASICGHSLQRPSLCDGHGPSGDISSQKDRPSFRTQSLVMSLSQDPERLSPTGQKVLPPIFGYVYTLFTLIVTKWIWSLPNLYKIFSIGTGWLSSS